MQEALPTACRRNLSPSTARELSHCKHDKTYFLYDYTSGEFEQNRQLFALSSGQRFEKPELCSG